MELSAQERAFGAEVGRCRAAAGVAQQWVAQRLGTVRLEKDTSLITAAQNWLTDHGMRLDDSAAGREELTSFLIAVGPLVSRGDDVQFLHHSFAEHLAATAKARRLPATFDAQEHGFARLMHAAGQGDRGRHARAVLLHYARLHPTEADRILEWLHNGSGDSQLLAARLLAQHLPAGAEPVDAFLATARAWAMTTQYPGREILRQVSRAGHHPGLVSWLAELLRDQALPWPSRIEAATALATRLRGPYTDGPAAVRARAELAKLTGQRRRKLITEAEHTIADHARPRHERRQAVDLLDAIAPAPTTAMLTCLNTELEHGQLPDRRRVELLFALRPINGLDPLRALRDDPNTTSATRWRAATKLTGYSSADRAAAAGILNDLATAATTRAALRWRAARDLADLGPAGRTMAIKALRTIANDTTQPATARANAARELAQTQPTSIREATDSLHALTGAPNPLHRIQVYRAIAALDTIDAVPALRAMADDNTLSPVARLRAAETIAEFRTDYREPAAIVARQLLNDPAVPHQCARHRGPRSRPLERTMPPRSP